MDVDDTLVLILERIDSVVTLIRAACTCRRWRRLIADAGFLRRYRSLHGPQVAGDFYNDYAWTTHPYSPSFVPTSSIDCRHFSLDFVVNVHSWDNNLLSIFPYRRWDMYQSWEVLDSRGSLLLMECVHETHIPGVFPDLVVCEPLTWRYKIIPQPPDFDGANWELRHLFLVDGDEDDAGDRISMSNFRVLCALSSHDGVVLRTTIFTAGSDTVATWSTEDIDYMGCTRENEAYPCEISWPPVFQACLD